MLHQALAGAAPPACPRPPRLAVLAVGEPDGARFEHRFLAEALGVPLVRPADLWPRSDGGVEASVRGQRLPVDVLHSRVPEAELTAHPTPVGQPLSALLAEAVRAGRLGLANVPGNGLADDPAMYAYVPSMIRFYLGEEPALPSVPTWVLADPAAWAEVRTRLQELVVTPLDGYGGGRPVVGPACSAAELAQLQAEVAAAPHRFVAQEPVDLATVPALVEGRLLPRPADLRVFSVAGARPQVLPAPLTRLTPADGATTQPACAGATKDTWLLS